MSGSPWSLWRRQGLALARQELWRTLFSRRSIPAYLLIAMPILLGALFALIGPPGDADNVGRLTKEFANTFHFFILRFIIFFGCAGLFINLFRGEILDRSLHYALLAPVRREILVAGKYFGGVASTVALFVPTVAITYLLFHWPLGLGALLRHLTAGPGLGQMASYAAVVVLACIGYGAVFLLAGLFFKNPMVPAILFLGWEILTPFLPKILKALSLVHYLGSLNPVPVSQGPFALLASPVPAWLAVSGLLGFSAVMLALAAWKARHLEITYSVD
jgi:ABC-type transport system involved in multi-copper enzyme maturation permease subunit